jgi:SurA-like protein
MLDQLRRHAANWVVKTTLAVIIFTFILFFGWSRVANRYQDAHMYVAVVDGEGISRRKYDAMYQESVDRLRENISGNLPANMDEILRRNVLDQLITREIIARYAKQLGLTVTDEEVAQYIRNNTGLFADGKFDLQTYERNFLPSYRRQTGEDFEEAIRRDLLIEKMQTLVMTLYEPWESELDESLDKIQGEMQKLQKTDVKIGKNKGPESNPESNPLAPSVTSASPLDLFTDWVQDLRQKTKVETYSP